MNDRSDALRHLLPADASPGDTLVVAGPRAARLVELARYRSVLWSRAPHGAPAAVRGGGFPHVRCFTAVPGHPRARWYLPVGPRRVVRRACDLYAPTTGAGRLARAVARALASLGGGPLLGDRVLLASREPSRLEASLAAAIGQRPFHLSISLPHQTGQRERLWVLLVDDAGGALAFAKFAYGSDSVHSLKGEVEFTRRVLERGPRTFVVPAVLWADDVDDGFLMVSMPLATGTRDSGAALTSRHFGVLAELAGHAGSASVRELVAQLRVRTELLSRNLPRAWGDRLAQAQEAVEACPGLDGLPTVMAHGDFVPWNIRRRQGDERFVVFDWEQGQESQFVLWDAFNFVAQVDIVLRRPAPAASVGRALALVGASPLASALRLTAKQVAALQLAYLADASAGWFEIHRPFSTWEFEMRRTRTQPMRAGMIDAALAAARPARG